MAIRFEGQVAEIVFQVSGSIGGQFAGCWLQLAVGLVMFSFAHLLPSLPQMQGLSEVQVRRW